MAEGSDASPSDLDGTEKDILRVNPQMDGEAAAGSVGGVRGGGAGTSTSSKGENLANFSTAASAAALTGALVSTAISDTSAILAAPAPAFAVISLSERQRQQREAQRNFLRSKGLPNPTKAGGSRAEREKGSFPPQTPSVSATAESAYGPAASPPYPPFPAYPETMRSLGFLLQKGRGGGGDGSDAFSSVMGAARKVGVGLAGGAMVGIGAVVAIAPTPGGILLAGAGMGVLATEFDGAKRAMDKGRSKLVDLIDALPGEKGRREEDKNTKEEGGFENEDGEGEILRNRGGRSSNSSYHEINDESPERTAVGERYGQVTTAAGNNAFHDRLGHIGRSIRPLIADDDAPRKAFDEIRSRSGRTVDEMKAISGQGIDHVKSSTNRAFGRMRNHLNGIVDTLAVTDEYVDKVASPPSEAWGPPAAIAATMPQAASSGEHEIGGQEVQSS